MIARHCVGLNCRFVLLRVAAKAAMYRIEWGFAVMRTHKRLLVDGAARQLHLQSLLWTVAITP